MILTLPIPGAVLLYTNKKSPLTERGADSGDDSGIGTGIVYYDPETKKCQRYGETDDAGLGITINPTLSKLF